jgi:hypothetical protein
MGSFGSVSLAEGTTPVNPYASAVRDNEGQSAEEYFGGIDYGQNRALYNQALKDYNDEMAATEAYDQHMYDYKVWALTKKEELFDRLQVGDLHTYTDNFTNRSRVESAYGFAFQNKASRIMVTQELGKDPYEAYVDELNRKAYVKQSALSHIMSTSGRSDTMTNWSGGDVYDITKAGGALYYAAKIPDVPMPGKKPKLRENAKAVMQTDFLQHEFDMRPLKTSAYDDESSNLQIITYMTTANGKTVVLSNDGVHIDQELSHGGGSGSSMVGGSFGTTTNGNLGTYGVSTQALTSLSAGAKIGGFAGQVAGAMGYGGSMSAFGGALGAMATGNFGEALGLGMQTMAAQAMGPMGMVFGAIGVDVATGNFSNGTMASTTTAMTSLSVGVVSNVATQAIAGAFGVTNTLATLGIGLAISYGLNSALESMAEANRAAYDAMDMETLGEIIGNNALELADRGVIGLDGRFTGETVQDFADYSGHLNSIESATYKGVKEALEEQATLSGMYNTKGTISDMLGTDLSGEGGKDRVSDAEKGRQDSYGGGSGSFDGDMGV